MSVFLHGRGLVCGLGDSLDAAAQTLSNSVNKPQQITLPDGSTRPYFLIDHPAMGWQERVAQLVCQAVKQSGVADRVDMPLIIASSSINVGQAEELGVFPDGCLPFVTLIRNSLAWQGKIYLIPVACTASMQAFLMAKQLLDAQYCTDVLVLGVELYNRVTASGFASMQLLASHTAQPLGSHRDGIVLGEAVAAWHLSTQVARWQLLDGASMVCGLDPTGASPDVIAQLCQNILNNNDLAATQIDLIKLQAAGSPQNDINELQGLAKVFDLMPPLTTLKHRVGHTLGASGMVELMLLMACLGQGLNPVYDYPLDQNLAAHLVLKYPHTEYLLSLILGFAGEHAALLLRDHGVAYA